MCEHNCMVRTPKAANTETTKQKQHTTQNHSPSSSVAISVKLLFALVFAPYIFSSHLAQVFAPCIGPVAFVACSVFTMSTSSSLSMPLGSSCTSHTMLRKGQSVCWDDGDVYFVRGWTVFTDPADKLRCWYWKEASGEATWNFPADDAVIAFSKRDVPDGWDVYRDEKGTVWWWHEARNCYTYIATRPPARYVHLECMSLHMLLGTSTSWRKYNATRMSWP